MKRPTLIVGLKSREYSDLQALADALAGLARRQFGDQPVTFAHVVASYPGCDTFQAFKVVCAGEWFATAAVQLNDPAPLAAALARCAAQVAA